MSSNAGSENRKPKVFISYAKENKEAAARLRDDLDRAGAAPWIDTEDMRAGEQWEPEIQRVIREWCDFFVALISSDSVNKTGYVQREIKTALGQLNERPPGQVFVIPVKLDECEPKDQELSEIHWIKMYPQWDQGMAKLVRALGLSFEDREEATWEADSEEKAGAGTGFREVDRQVEMYVEAGVKEVLRISRHRKLRLARSVQLPHDRVRREHVKFASEAAAAMGPFPFNDAFPLRFYLPHYKASRLMIMINGLAEGKTRIWDRLGSTFAANGMAAVLLPLPQHFCRHILFNCNDFFEDDEYRLDDRELLDKYTASIKYGLLAHPRSLVRLNYQLMADIACLVAYVTGRRDPSINTLKDFVDGNFEERPKCSILGFSLGGLCALQSFLNDPDAFNSCVLVNSGASFQDMNASQVFKDEWRDVQRGVVDAARAYEGVKARNFDTVFLGNNKVDLHDMLEQQKQKLLLVLGGSDEIINTSNIHNLMPSKTGLAMFQIPSLSHFINVPNMGGRTWDEWSQFTVEMILSFDSNRPGP
ncbi:MAG: TIR domain-containing protein [Planctomycetota bacterium]